jgi:Chaperone of endosialidase
VIARSNSTRPATLNTANGAIALFSNLTGSENTANGVAALSNNATGSRNTANGVRALSRNSTGFNNTANGVDALLTNDDGRQNTATGANALRSNTTGSFNTAEGVRALFNNTAGDNNIALGNSAGFNLTTGSNNIDIGAFGATGDANTIRIGRLAMQNRTFIAGIRGVTTGIANAVPVLIDTAGQLGTISSSRRFKKEIKAMDKTSEAILALKPVTFHYKSDHTGTPQFGLIAEEVAQVNPNLVVRDNNGEIYTVRYEAVNAMLLNEFLKQQKAALEEHRKVEKLEATVAGLVATVKEQASQIQKVSAQLELSKTEPQTVLNNH